MFGKKKVTFTLSKKAMKMVENGEAMISAGGVRTLDGKMVEMVQPTVSSKTSDVLSSVVGKIGDVNEAVSQIKSIISGGGINLVSSLAANVQCGFIQHGVNIANNKLDKLMETVSSIADALGNLSTINVLSWVNSAFSVANMGISIKGFKDTLAGLDNVQDSINEFVDMYKADRHNDMIQQYGVNRDNLLRTLDYLEEFYEISSDTDDYFKIRVDAIEHILVEAENYIKRIMHDFTEHRIDCQLGCDIIFNLTSIFTQTMNAYMCQYYYVYGKACTRISALDLLEEIKSPEFKAAMRAYMDDPAVFTSVSPISLAAARRVAFESINQQENRLNACAEIVKMLPREEFKHLDEKLNTCLLGEMQKEVPELNGASVEDYLTERFNKGEYTEDGDSIVISL